MKLHQDDSGALNTVTAYDAGYIEINAQRHAGGIFFMPEGAISRWGIDTLADLDIQHLEPLLALQPEIILLGTGATQIFPKPAQLAPIIRSRTGYEVMSTPAACRTYNILMAEGRQVMAAVLQINA